MAPNPSSPPSIAIVPNVFDSADGAETPFSRRWGGDVFQLTTEHPVALKAGQTLALDVRSEYVAFLKVGGTANAEPPNPAGQEGVGNGE